MKLQTLFEACNTIIKRRIEKNPEASVKIESGEAITYKNLSQELENLKTWCYHGEFEVQKVVRCKHCKNYKRYKKKNPKNPYEHKIVTACALDKTQRHPEFFCYYGEEADK